MTFVDEHALKTMLAHGCIARNLVAYRIYTSNLPIRSCSRSGAAGYADLSADAPGRRQRARFTCVNSEDEITKRQ